MKEYIKNIPIIGSLIRNIYWRIKGNAANIKPFPGSEKYWNKRYNTGGNSGFGSRGKLAEFKADVINNFVVDHSIKTVIEFGCGDGNQLKLANYPFYIGFDTSETAVALCKGRLSFDNSKKFRLITEYKGDKADLTLSLDVIFHLVENDVFEEHMRTLFGASNRYVIIYSSNYENNISYYIPHIRHREFTKWIQENLDNWKFIKKIPNNYPYKGDDKTGSFADFFMYEKV